MSEFKSTEEEKFEGRDTAEIGKIFTDISEEVEAETIRTIELSIDQTCLLSTDDSVCLRELRKIESMLDSGYSINDLDKEVVKQVFEIAGKIESNPKLTVHALEVLSYLCFQDDDEMTEVLQTNILGLLLDIISVSHYSEAIVLALDIFHNAIFDKPNTIEAYNNTSFVSGCLYILDKVANDPSYFIIEEKMFDDGKPIFETEEEKAKAQLMQLSKALKELTQSATLLLSDGLSFFVCSEFYDDIISALSALLFSDEVSSWTCVARTVSTVAYYNKEATKACFTEESFLRRLCELAGCPNDGLGKVLLGAINNICCDEPNCAEFIVQSPLFTTLNLNEAKWSTERVINLYNLYETVFVGLKGKDGCILVDSVPIFLNNMFAITDGISFKTKEACTLALSAVINLEDKVILQGILDLDLPVFDLLVEMASSKKSSLVENCLLSLILLYKYGEETTNPNVCFEAIQETPWEETIEDIEETSTNERVNQLIEAIKSDMYQDDDSDGD